MSGNTIRINRAPVLTLWATVVAEHLGFDHDEALTLGKAVAGLNAQTKGRSLGIYGPPKVSEGEAAKKQPRGEEFRIEVCGRPVPAKNTDDGIRAVIGDRPIAPAGVQRYIQGKFGADLDAVRDAMNDLAGSFSPEELASRAYRLYEAFRPEVSPGIKGWGQPGELDPEKIRSLARGPG